MLIRRKHKNEELNWMQLRICWCHLGRIFLFKFVRYALFSSAGEDIESSSFLVFEEYVTDRLW